MIAIHFILFLIAWILVIPLTLWNAFLVWNNKYFLDTAKSIDIWANREFRTLWNTYLINDSGYKFGALNETISSVLGKNARDKTLTKTGVYLAKFLDFLDKNHCESSINDLIN